MHIRKLIGLVILVLGVAFGLYAADRILTSCYVAIGLVLIFFSRERIEDERVQSLKMKAMFTAMSATSGLLVVVHMSYLDFLAAEAPRRALRVLSAPELLALVMLMAVGFFHYWRWQDGRTGAETD